MRRNQLTPRAPLGRRLLRRAGPCPTRSSRELSSSDRTVRRRNAARLLSGLASRSCSARFGPLRRTCPHTAPLACGSCCPRVGLPHDTNAVEVDAAAAALAAALAKGVAFLAAQSQDVKAAMTAVLARLRPTAAHRSARTPDGWLRVWGAPVALH